MKSSSWNFPLSTPFLKSISISSPLLNISSLPCAANAEWAQISFIFGIARRMRSMTASWSRTLVLEDHIISRPALRKTTKFGYGKDGGREREIRYAVDRTHLHDPHHLLPSNQRPPGSTALLVWSFQAWVRKGKCLVLHQFAFPCRDDR